MTTDVSVELCLARTKKRVAELEEAFMLFAGLLTGEPADATAEEKEAVQRRLALLFEGMRERMR